MVDIYGWLTYILIKHAGKPPDQSTAKQPGRRTCQQTGRIQNFCKDGAIQTGKQTCRQTRDIWAADRLKRAPEVGEGVNTDVPARDSAGVQGRACAAVADAAAAVAVAAAWSRSASAFSARRCSSVTCLTESLNLRFIVPATSISLLVTGPALVRLTCRLTRWIRMRISSLVRLLRVYLIWNLRNSSYCRLKNYNVQVWICGQEVTAKPDCVSGFAVSRQWSRIQMQAATHFWLERFTKCVQTQQRPIYGQARSVTPHHSPDTKYVTSGTSCQRFAIQAARLKIGNKTFEDTNFVGPTCN